MALDSSDLQQRRKATARRPTSKRRTANTGGRTTTIRRRRRRRRSDDPRRAVLVGTVLCGTIAITLVLITNRLLGKGSSATSNSNTSNDRLLRDWKRKLEKYAINNSPSVEDPKAKEKARQREERYKSLYMPKFDASELGYDIYNCPPTPPDQYPMAWKTTDVLSNWNPNDVTTLPPAHRDVYQGLCVFDYQTQYAMSLKYRNAEKPFVIRNDPKVTSVVRRWDDDPEYLHRILGDVEQYRTERSPNNYFMWYRLRGSKRTPNGYQRPPNDEIEMTLGEWFEHALDKDGKSLGDEGLVAKAAALRERRLSLMPKRENHEDDPLGNDIGVGDENSEEAKQEEYYYFRLNADLRRAREASPSKFIYDELPFFDPRKRKDSEFYIVEPVAERGINCRFGMRGVVAANHFDMSRNMIAVFGGERRYVLGSPSQCSKMALYPQGHPSVRHSSIDWSNPLDWDKHPDFKNALINEVVLHAGDVLYLPTNWFHFIVNLSINYQCNARSGTSHETSHYIEACGFKGP